MSPVPPSNSDAPFVPIEPTPSDWWQASDGRWYPAHLHPDAAPAAADPGHQAAGGLPPSGQSPAWDAGGWASPGWYGQGATAWYDAATPAAPTAPWGPPLPPNIGYHAGPTWSAYYGPPPIEPRPRRRVLATVIGFVVLAAVVLTAATIIPVVHALGSRSSSPAEAPAVPTGGFVAPVPAALARGEASLLTPAVTRAVVQEIWPRIAGVSTDAEFNQLPLIATPDVVDLIHSQLVCGCGLWLPTFSSLEVSAPPEPSYPLTFLAEIDQPTGANGAEIQLAEFAKRSPDEPWLMVHLTGWGGTYRELVAGASLAGEADALAPGATTFDQLADLFVTLRQSGSAEPGNPWDGTVSGPQGNQPTVTEHHFLVNHQDDVAAGYTASASYQVVDYSPNFWTGTMDIQCATIRGRIVVIPNPGVRMFQPTSQTSFGPQVPPGTYSSVTELASFEVCIDRVDATQANVVGLLGGLYSSTGASAG